MESGIDPGQDYYTQDYYNYDHGYDLPQYGSRRKLIPPSGLYDEYGEVVVDDNGSFYYSPHESDGEQGNRKRRIKPPADREYETSSTGEDSAPETQRGHLPSTLDGHANVNGGVYVAQNGSVIRTRRAECGAGGPHAHSAAHDNLKLPSPVFSSRLAKHFKKLDKMAATLEEMAPLSSRRTAAGGGGGGRNALRTFRTSAASSFSDADGRRTPSALRSGASSGSTGEGNAGPGGGASRSNPLKVERDEPGGGEDESRVDDAGGGGEGEEEEEDGGLVEGEPPECPGDRTQSDEGELWMGPWNSLHIPMTKL